MSKIVKLLISALLVLVPGRSGVVQAQSAKIMGFKLTPISVSGFSDSARQVPVSQSVLSDPDHFVWGGSVVRGDDGRYHMFFSYFDAGKILPVFSDSWLLSSKIGYARSDYPDHGFRFIKMVLGGAAADGNPGAWDAQGVHNPHIKKFNGKYYLYYIGSRDPGERPAGDPGAGLGKRDRIQQVQTVSVIAVDHLDDLINGNFKRPVSPLMMARTRVKPNPVIDPSPQGTAALPDNLIMVNPTVVYRPSDKKYLMYFKGNLYDPGWRGVHGVAIADDPAGPFHQQDDFMFGLRTPDGKLASAEDPYVWYHPGTELFYAVFKDFQGHFTGAAPGLAVMISRDGIHWEMHPERVFTAKELPLSDGSSIPLSNMERPQFLINEKGEPVAFYAACSIGPCGSKTDGSTFNAQFGIKIHYIPQKQVSALDFGAVPDDTLNDREALQKALDFCRLHSVRKLVIPPGTYVIKEEKAVQLMKDIMDGKMGKNPQDVIYTPYYPYTRGLSFRGISDLDVEARGVFLSVQGWMEPLSVEYCNNITIRGLTIDHQTMPHSEGVITNEADRWFDVHFTADFPVRDNMVMPRIMFWDPAKNRLLGNSIYFPEKNELIAPQTLRIQAPHPANILGTMALIDHTFHFRPAILIHEASNTTLEQVTIHSQPGMGIVGHRSENILMNGLRIVPRPGYYQSTNTDATHFTSCKGTIRFNGCTFEGQGDDATNVHGYYQVIKEKTGLSSYRIEMEKKWGTHAMVLDFPDKTDTLELVSKKTLEVLGTYVVAKVDTFPQKWETVVELDRPLPGNIENYYLIDVTRLPRLEFVNTYVGSHLARAVLVKTRNVLIENCTMRESTGTAIHVGAEGDWREGAGSQNVIIRNNRILRCGRGDGTQDGASAIAINVKAPDITVAGIHKKILIEGNLIEGEQAECGISVSGARDVMIRNNEFSGCKTPVKIRYSEGVRMENNFEGKARLKN